jgi:3-oxoacyl-[acyl-carrier protein] reductase
MSQYASRIMSRNQAGSIINLTSIIGTNGNVGQSVYGGSKAAVIGITKSLAKELADKNIRVNAIAPGFIDTDMARSIPDEIFKQRVDSVAMKRIGNAGEIAGVACFLASELSSYVTGQVIGVDGGMLI